jgi:hypothetical protein
MHTLRRFAPVFIILLFVLLFAIVGCAAVERFAQSVQHVAGGQPTTQPTPAENALRGIGQAASAASPAVGGILNIVALAAAAVAGVAGHFNGKRSERKNAHTVIAEIVGDVAAFKEPGTPWTDKTKKLLTSLGYEEHANVVDLVEAVRSQIKS